MTGTDVTRFTHKSVPVIFEPPCIYIYIVSTPTRFDASASSSGVLYFYFAKVIKLPNKVI